MIHYALILAAGEGSRIKNNTRKQFLELNGLPVAMHSVRAFNQADPETIIYIALPNRHKLVWKKLCQKHHFKIKHKIYIGGDSRAETVLKGLKQIYKDSAFAVCADDNQKNNTLVSIHDAARPFIDSKFILELIHAAKRFGSAIPFLNLKNSLRSLKTHRKKVLSKSKDRESNRKFN